MTAAGVSAFASTQQVWISRGCVDIRDVELNLPAGIIRCYACGGNGKRRQWYCDAPSMTGPCDSCKATGFMFEATAKPVSPSVTHQIAVANGFDVRPVFAYGLDWTPRASSEKPRSHAPDSTVTESNGAEK